MKKWDGGKIFTIFVVTILVSGAITVGLFTADAFAYSGTKKLFITGQFAGVKIPLYSCFVTTDVDPASIEHFAKGSGVVHADLDPVGGISATEALTVTCTVGTGAISGSTPSSTMLKEHGPTKIFVQLS